MKDLLSYSTTSSKIPSNLSINAANKNSSTKETSQKPKSKNLTQSNNNDYVDNFVCQPEQFIGMLVPVFRPLHDDSTRKACNKYRIEIDKIFKGKDEVFLGISNSSKTFLVIPDENGGYKKFYNSYLYRDISKISPIKNGITNSGTLIRFKLTDDIRSKVIKNISESMVKHEGERNITCVQSSCKVLEDAGFKSGSYPLSKRKLSSEILSGFLKDGFSLLDNNGKEYKLDFDIVRTNTNKDLYQNYQDILLSQANNIPIYSYNALIDIQKNIFGVKDGIINNIKSTTKSIPTAKLMEDSKNHKRDLEIFASIPSDLGYKFRNLWGAHTIYSINNPSRVKINKFFTKKLHSFAPVYKNTQTKQMIAESNLTDEELQGLNELSSKFKIQKPDNSTWLKSNVLLSLHRVSFISSHLSSDEDNLGKINESKFLNMLKTHSKKYPAKYNIVITRNQIKFERIYKHSKVSSVLSKHRLIAGNKIDEETKEEVEEEVFFAGEFCKKEDGKIYLNNDSGTYRPSLEILNAAACYLREVMPNIEIIDVGHINLDEELDAFIQEKSNK